MDNIKLDMEEYFLCNVIIRKYANETDNVTMGLTLEEMIPFLLKTCLKNCNLSEIVDKLTFRKNTDVFETYSEIDKSLKSIKENNDFLEYMDKNLLKYYKLLASFIMSYQRNRNFTLEDNFQILIDNQVDTSTLTFSIYRFCPECMDEFSEKSFQKVVKIICDTLKPVQNISDVKQKNSKLRLEISKLPK